jgi:hypothetical protein
MDLPGAWELGCSTLRYQAKVLLGSHSTDMAVARGWRSPSLKRGMRVDFIDGPGIISAECCCVVVEHVPGCFRSQQPGTLGPRVDEGPLVLHHIAPHCYIPGTSVQPNKDRKARCI